MSLSLACESTITSFPTCKHNVGLYKYTNSLVSWLTEVKGKMFLANVWDTTFQHLEKKAYFQKSLEPTRMNSSCV